MTTFCLSDEGEGVGRFMKAAEFAETAVGEKTLRRARELNKAERVPEIFTDTCRNSFLAKKGELLQ